MSKAEPAAATQEFFDRLYDISRTRPDVRSSVARATEDEKLERWSRSEVAQTLALHGEVGKRMLKAFRWHMILTLEELRPFLDKTHQPALADAPGVGWVTYYKVLALVSEHDAFLKTIGMQPGA